MEGERKIYMPKVNTVFKLGTNKYTEDNFYLLQGRKTITQVAFIARNMQIEIEVICNKENLCKDSVAHADIFYFLIMKYAIFAFSIN